MKFLKGLLKAILIIPAILLAILFLIFDVLARVNNRQGAMRF